MKAHNLQQTCSRIVLMLFQQFVIKSPSSFVTLQYATFDQIQYPLLMGWDTMAHIVSEYKIGKKNWKNVIKAETRVPDAIRQRGASSSCNRLPPPYNPGSDVIKCECTVRTVRTIFYLTPCNGGKIFYFTPVYVQYVQFLSNVIQCTYCTCIVGYKLRR